MMPRPLAYTLCILAVALWSGGTIIGRALHEVIGPSTLSFWRWFAVMVLVAPIALPRVIRLWPTIRAHFWVLMAFTAAGASLYQPATYLALRYTEAVNASIFAGSAPIFVILAAWLVEGERMTARRWVGIALEPAEDRGIDGFGVAHAEIHTLPLLAIEYAIIGPTLPSPQFIAAIAYLVFFASTGGFLAWNAGVPVVGINQAGAVMYLSPVVGTVGAIVLLGETFRTFHAIGIAAILTGVVIATGAAKNQRPTSGA